MADDQEMSGDAAAADTDRSGEQTSREIAPLTPEAEQAANEPGSPLPRFWAGVKRLPKYARVAASLIADGEVPKRSKVALGIGGAYAFSPIDLVPGVIPVAGQLDDLYVLLRALRQALHSAPPEVSARHLHAVDLTMADVEADIKAIEETTVWLIRKGIERGSEVAAAGWQKGSVAAAAGWQRMRGFVDRTRTEAAARTAPASRSDANGDPGTSEPTRDTNSVAPVRPPHGEDPAS